MMTLAYWPSPSPQFPAIEFICPGVSRMGADEGADGWAGWAGADPGVLKSWARAISATLRARSLGLMSAKLHSTDTEKCWSKKRVMHER